MHARTIPIFFLLLSACSDEGSQMTADASTGGGNTTSTSGEVSSDDASAGDASTSSDASTGTTSTGGESGESSSSGSSTGEDIVDCSDRPMERPSARGEIDGVWDAPRGRMVMFGGDQGTPVTCMSQTDFVAETWAFHPDCDNFEQIIAEGPSARGRHATAHDPQRGWMIIHGGRWRDGTSGTYTLRGDTWALDLASDTWVQVANDGPSPRTNHAAVVSGDQMLLFGGNTSTSGLQFIPQDDLWSLDLNDGTWTELEVSGGPSARLFHAATISADGNTMFIYGGGDQNAFVGPFSGELWAFDIPNETWSLVHTTNAEPLRTIWGDLMFDQKRNALILWGAHEDNLLGNANKIWTFDLDDASDWTMVAQGDVLQANSAGFCDFPADFVDPDLDAPERRSAGAAVLTDDDAMVVFGGKTDCGIIDDVWIRDLQAGTWDRRIRATAGEICVRAFAEGCTTMCY